MDAIKIRDLKLFFSTILQSGSIGGIEIYLREKRVMFDEKSAIFTDAISYNGLFVGDLCYIPDGYGLNPDNYEIADPGEMAFYKEKVMMRPRIILAFFKINRKLTFMKRPVMVERIFCATGTEWYKRLDYFHKLRGYLEELPTLTVNVAGSSIKMEIDASENEGKYYVKLFRIDLLKKIEE